MEKPKLSWDDVTIPDESVTKKDQEAAEQMGKWPPLGKYLCRCVDSVPRERKFEEYTCFEANLKWQIGEVLVLNGVPQSEKDFDAQMASDLEGKFFFDGITLYNPKEKDGFRKRRILVAKRTGLLKANQEEQDLKKSAWAEDIKDKWAIITVAENKYEDKNGQTKISHKVAFDGYESADKASESKGTAEYGDI